MMRRLFFVVAASLLLIGGGCRHHNLACGGGCNSCGAGDAQADHVPRLPAGAMRQMGPAGPPSAAYAYPYYTNRAPRDFLASDPWSVGH